MENNVKLLRATACKNKHLDITIFPVAIGSSRGTCSLYSGSINVGDCHLICEGENPPPPKGNEIYELRGTTEVRLATDIIPDDTIALKVDIEGAECGVFKGLNNAPPTIVSETTWTKSMICVNDFAQLHGCEKTKMSGDTYLQC